VHRYVLSWPQDREFADFLAAVKNSPGSFILRVNAGDILRYFNPQVLLNFYFRKTILLPTSQKATKL